MIVNRAGANERKTLPLGFQADQRRDAIGNVQKLIIPLAIAAPVYNAVFAMLAARGVPMNVNIVTGMEIAILLLVLVTSLINGVRPEDMLPLAFIYVTVALSVLMSLGQERVAIDGLRNVLIVAGFTLLGTRATERTVRIVFATCSALALAVLIWEISAVESYAAFFRPADYLAKTRGYEVKEFYADVGLSVGTIAYSSRFSFGIFNGPRTSSIFLEQVGINCFAIVLMVYASTMWSRLSLWERLLTLTTVVLIILSNNARLSAVVAPILLVGYFLFPKLPRYASAMTPVVLLTFTLLLFQFEEPRIGDDLIGRVGVTYRYFSRFTTSDLLIGNMSIMRRAFDTGYGYIIASMTIFGAFAYWAYLIFIVPQDSVFKRRAAWSMNTYIYLWLLIGGTASFSMKTASLLWFLMGFVRVAPADGDVEREASAGSASRLLRPAQARGALRVEGRIIRR